MVQLHLPELQFGRDLLGVIGEMANYITMYDSLSLGEIPSHPEAVAGYVNGSYTTWDSVLRDFPGAHHLSIAVNADGIADFLDCEHGDAVMSQAPGWLDAMLKRGVERPGIYAQMSYWESGELYRLLEPFGSRIRRWCADWTYHEHLPTGYDACQWSGGQYLDISLCAANFFGPPPPPPDPYHYLWFQDKTFDFGKTKVNERDCVETYDKVRLHAVVHAVELRRTLRPRLKDLADRVAQEALYDEHGKKRKNPEWDRYYRGFRFQQLNRRSQGEQIVK